MEKIWVSRFKESNEVKQIQKETQLPLSICKLLYANGIKTKEQANTFLTPVVKEGFRNPSFKKLLSFNGVKNNAEAQNFFHGIVKSQLHSPFLMTDMKKAVERLSLAIDRKERILFHGDYDGVTR